VLDACVLYPAPLRDILIEAARSGLYRARWTEQIHDEWTRNLLLRRPELAMPLDRTRRLMNQAVEGCLVTGFEGRIEGISLPDPGDRHVLAAAVRCSADTIVTLNLKDFPETVLRRYGMAARHPDEFLLDHFGRGPAKLVTAARAVRLRLRNPARTVDEYLTTLEAQELHRVVHGLRAHASLCCAGNWSVQGLDGITWRTSASPSLPGPAARSPATSLSPPEDGRHARHLW